MHIWTRLPSRGVADAPGEGGLTSQAQFIIDKLRYYLVFGDLGVLVGRLIHPRRKSAGAPGAAAPGERSKTIILRLFSAEFTRKHILVTGDGTHEHSPESGSAPGKRSALKDQEGS